MRVMLSAAVTADGYLDHNAPERLVISTPEDWAEVYHLRAMHDAILVGAQTLRRDNPSLLIRDEQVRTQRELAGRTPDIAKVTITESGDLAPSLNFFTRGQAEKFVFSTHEITELSHLTTVISSDSEVLTARYIVTELEKRGIERLFVEGGAKTLRMFMHEGMADTLRLAVNPNLRLGPAAAAPRLEIGDEYLATPSICEELGGMVVHTYALRPPTEVEDLKYLRLAITESSRCTPSATSYCVGAVVVTDDALVFTGYTHETSPTHHAEQEAIAKALAAGARLRGASIYSSMEPCSKRSSEPESCTELILRHGFAHVAFALYEPSHFVSCRGALILRERGVDVRAYPSLGDEVRQVNAHLSV